MQIYGWMGRVLRINLTTKSFNIEDLDIGAVYNFIGGRGLNSYILYKELDPRIDPFSPENKVILSVGPLTATEFPGAGRAAFTSKSPLTGTIFTSLIGGIFGARVKSTGFDAIIFEGSSSAPLYLVVDENGVRFEDAFSLWGETTSRTEAKLKEKYPGTSIACIGPAGENLVRIANIASDTRFAGRGGLGAVLGSKKIKAIVVKGRRRPQLYDPKSFRELAKKARYIISTHPLTGIDGALAHHGTAHLIHVITNAGLLPVNNFSDEARLKYEDVDSFSGETIAEKYFLHRKACYGCPTGCGRIIKVGDHVTKGPEYESIAMLGPNSGFYDFEREILPLVDLCDDLGIDTISAGNIMGFARKAGVVKGFDDAVKLLRDIASGTSPFSHGVREAAKQLNLEDEAVHVKGLELPAYHPAKAWGIALSYATTSRGGCHLGAYTIAFEILNSPEYVSPEDASSKPPLVKRMQDAFAVYDSAIICKYHSLALFLSLNFELDDLAKALSAATGLHYTDEELHRIGAMIIDVERLFNISAGLSPEHDALPRRFKIDLAPLLEEYYKLRGWVNGIPRKEAIQLRKPKLAKLGELAITPLRRLTPPQVQVALDMDAPIEVICDIAVKAYSGGARLIEAGTPALKRHGADNLVPALINSIKRYCDSRREPYEAVIVADAKTMDVGNLEARIMFRSGADAIVVLAIGGDEKIFEALSEAIRRDRAIIIDFIQVEDPLARLEDLVKKLKGYEPWVMFCLHRGISEHIRSRGIHDSKTLIAEARKIAGNFLLSVAGGIKEGTAKEVASCGAEVCVVGSAIYNSTNPRETTQRILQEIREHYPLRS